MPQAGQHRQPARKKLSRFSLGRSGLTWRKSGKKTSGHINRANRPHRRMLHPCKSLWAYQLPGMSLSKVFLPVGGLSLNTRFLGPTQVYIPTDISTDSAIFSRLIVMTNRHTDRQKYRPHYSIDSNRWHLASTAIRPKIAVISCKNKTSCVIFSMQWSARLRRSSVTGGGFQWS